MILTDYSNCPPKKRPFPMIYESDKEGFGHKINQQNELPEDLSLKSRFRVRLILSPPSKVRRLDWKSKDISTEIKSILKSSDIKVENDEKILQNSSLKQLLKNVKSESNLPLESVEEIEHKHPFSIDYSRKHAGRLSSYHSLPVKTILPTPSRAIPVISKPLDYSKSSSALFFKSPNALCSKLPSTLSSSSNNLVNTPRNFSHINKPTCRPLDYSQNTQKPRFIDRTLDLSLNKKEIVDQRDGLRLISEIALRTENIRPSVLRGPTKNLLSNRKVKEQAENNFKLDFNTNRSWFSQSYLPLSASTMPSSQEVLNPVFKPEPLREIVHPHSIFSVEIPQRKPVKIKTLDVENVNPIHQGESFPCSDCNRIFSTYVGLSRHQQFHCTKEAKKEFVCTYCPKTYTTSGAVKMHIRTHTLPCKCKYCGKAFSRPWLLQGHIRTHTGEKPFECSKCRRSFADRSNLRAHLQTHAEIKKYACEKCPKTFSRMSLLLKHRQSGCTCVNQPRPFYEAPVPAAKHFNFIH